MADSLPTFIRTHFPRRAAAAFALIVLMGLIEGASLLSLLPLLGLIGLDTGTTLAPISAALASVLEAVGLALTLGTVLAVFVALQLGLAGLAFVHARVAMTLQHRVVDRIRSGLRDDLEAAEWRYFRSIPRGRITNALTTEAERTGAMTYLALSLGAAAVILAVQIALALRIAPLLTAIVVAVALLTIALLRPYTRKATEIGKEMAGRMQQMHLATEQWLNAAKQARFVGSQPFPHEAGVMERQVEAIHTRATSRFLFDAASVAMLAVITYLALVPFAMELGAFLLLIYLFARILPRIKQAHQQVQMLNAVAPAWHNVQQLWSDVQDHAESADEQAAPEFKDSIELRGVKVHYGDTKALDGIDLVIKKGDKIAITGPNGAGKSTLVEVIAGLTRPDHGQVLIDGEPLQARKAWRQRVAYVPQEPAFIDGTVRENLAWVQPDATGQDMERALEQAACGYLNQKAGLETEIGVHGTALSGGQRQRLCLAMALIRQPDLLVLDEPTSHWDQAAQEKFGQVIQSLQDVTIIMVTHSRTYGDAVGTVVRMESGGVMVPAASA